MKTIKRIILSGLTLLWTTSMFGQYTNLELNHPLFENMTVSATQTITLKPGFSTQGYSFSAAISSQAFPVYQSVTPSLDQNYIRTLTPLTPIDEDEAEQIVNGTSTVTYYANQLRDDIQYFDGLGRLSQELAVAQSPAYNDLVAIHQYDDVGREATKYLPFTQNGNGAYVGNPSISATYIQAMYYANATLYGLAISPTPTAPYATTVFDGSPLNRVMKQGAPGADWQPVTTTTTRQSDEHVVSYEYSTNMSSETVFELEVDSNNKFLKKGNYSNNVLHCTTIEDENGQLTREYKDLQGQVILKELYNSGSWLRTYYIYDDFGLLRYVIPPRGYVTLSALAINTAQGTDAAWVNGLCYYYEYDSRKRMIKKNLPDADEVLMIYDNRDRIVLTQDGVMTPVHKFLFTKYDVLNRPCETGTVYIQGTYANIVAAFDDYAQSQVSHTSTVDYDNSIAFPAISGGSWNTPFVLTKTYYDTYDYPNKIAYAGPDTYETRVMGKLTGTKTRVGESGDLWTITTPYYDEYDRVKWSKQTVNFSTTVTGTEAITNTYTFSGNLLSTRQVQTFNGQTTDMTTYQLYDHAERLIQVDQQITGQTNRTTLATMYYNELGQLSRKVYGNHLQNEDFQYTIRGWLSSINNPDNTISDNDLFAMQLYYNDQLTNVTGTTQKQYNGNISAMRWVSPDYRLIPKQQAYGFTYDQVNRLREADYAEGGTLSLTNTYKLHNITYDLNGNITNLMRYGLDDTNMDNLTYTYNTTSNQLKKVSEAGNQTSGFKTNASAQAQVIQYTYDANGNMKTDLNKGVTATTFNYLNLPTQITLGSNTISYLYDAAGTKYKKNTSESNSDRYYFNNFEYSYNETASKYDLEYIHTMEGRVRVRGNYTYDYYLKDHLGNIRVVFSDNGNNNMTLQVSNYYPFGMQFDGSTTYQTSEGDNQYLYNGKELQQDFGLDWYDYGARMYDPALGRFMVQDRFAEKYHTISPYHYGANNPILHIDVNGDSLDISSLNEEQRNSIINDLNSQTGLSFYTNSSGYLDYQKEDGKAIIGEGGSETARDLMTCAVNNESTVFVTANDGEGSKNSDSKNEINLDFKQIENNIDGTVGADDRTLGYGMVFMHEVSHNKTLGNGLRDNVSSSNPRGDNVDYMNIIRSELNGKGGNYGQRTAYNPGVMLSDDGVMEYRLPLDDFGLDKYVVIPH